MANAYKFGAKYRNEERKKQADKTLSFNERIFAKTVGVESEAVAPYVTGVRRKNMGSNPNSIERNTVESLQYARYARDTTAQQRLQDRRDTISNTTTLGESIDNQRKANTEVARSLVNVAYSKLSASNNENYNSNYKSYLDASDRYGESLRKDYWNAKKDRAKSVGRMFTLNDEKRGQAVTDFKKYSNEVGDIQQSRNDLNKLDDSASDQNWIRLQKDAEAVKLLQQYGNAERMFETARNTATANNGLNIGANEQFATAEKQMAEIAKELKAKGYDVDSAYSTYQKHKQELAVNQMASAGEQFGKNNNVVATGLVGRGIHQLEKITGAAEMLADKFNYDVNDARNHTPLDIRDIVNSSQQLTAYDVEAEEQARKKLDKFGNISIMGRDFGGTGRVVYDAVTQGIDNTLDSLILGQGLLGGIKATGKSGKLGQFAVNASRAGSIYSQSKYSNLKQGMTTEEAEAKAIEDVGVEIATEMAGTALEKIKLDGVNNKGVRKAIDFSLTGGSEALEEIKGNIISTAIDYVRNGTGSETSQTYQTYLQQALDAGYSDKEAKDFAVLNTAKDKTSEGLYEGLVAFLSASGMSAVNASVGAIAENQQNKEIGKQIPNSSVQTLIDMATKEGIVNKDSEASKIANDILTSKNVTTAKLGRLARSVAEKTNADINTNAKANIITIVQQEKGVESDVAQEVAQAVVDNDAKGISKGANAIVKEIKAGETDFASKVTSEELTRTYLARNNASFVNDVSNGKTNATNLDDYLSSKGQLTSKQMQIKMSRVATSKVEDYTDEEMDALASNNTVSSDEVKRTYVKNGQLMAELKDGDIISGDSIQFRNENQSAIYRQLASNARGNEEFVASAIEAYDMMPQIANDNSDRFYSEARHFFRAGQQGITFEQALRYDKGGIMPRDAAAHIFNSGVKAKLTEGVKSYTKTAVTNRKANKGGVLTNNSDRALSKAEEGMLTLFAKKTGIDIVIDNLSKGNEGYYNSSTHTITLNGNADESLMAILLHENAEFATAWNNAEMNGLIDKIVEYILTNDRNGIDDEAIDVLEKYHKAYNSGDNKSTYSDTVKEACFNWLVGVASKSDNSDKFVSWLTSEADITDKEKKTLLNSFRELLTKMRDAFRDFFRKKGARERDIDGISKIFDEYLVIVDKAIENSKNAEAVKAVDDVISGKAKRQSKAVKGNLTENPDIRYSKVVDVEQRKQAQFDIVQESNPADDDYHTGIRSVDDIKTFDEAIVGYEDGVTPDFSKYQIEKAKKTGYVTIYSSYPIENGVFVTPSKMEAESYAGGGEVYQKRVPLTDVAWIDAGEGQYANVSEELQQQYALNGSLDEEEKVNRSSKVVEYNPDNLVNDENDDFVEIKNDLREQFAFMKTADKKQLKRSTMRNEQKGKSGVHASITQLEAIAKVLKKNHNSKINTLDLTNSLRLLYDHIINNDLSVEQAIDLASDTATDILTNTKSGRQLSNFATTVLEDLAKRNVSLSEEQLEAVRNEYGTKKYLNLISGRVGVNYNGKKGNALTDVWEELSASYPSVFDANTKEADMPRQLLEAIIGDETLVQNGLINQYSYDGKGNSFEDEKRLVALEMLKYFQQVPQFETVAEKQRKEYEKREAKLNAKIDRLNKDLKDQVQKKKDYVEARQKTKIKQEIRKVRDDLVNRLLNPKGKAYVPADLVSAVTDLVQAIDASSVDYPARIAKYTNLINELKDDDKNYAKKKAEYERVIANATQSMAQQTNAIAELESQFNALKKNKEYPNVYNEVISNCLATLKKNVGSTPLHSMTKEQLQQTLDAVKGVQKMVKDSISTINSELKENAFESGRKAIVEANRGKRISKRNPLRKAVTDLLSPERFFRRISGYKTGSVMSRLYEELNEGMHKAMTLTAKANDYFTDLISNKGKKAKELKDFQSTKGDKLIDVGLKDEKGNPVLLNRAFAVDLALTIADKQARNHLVYGGLNLPNLKAYYKGDANAYNYTVRIAPLGEQGVADLAEALEQQLTSYDKLWISQCRLCIDELLTPALNETTLDMYGFKRATVKNYWQINTDKNFVNKPMDTVVNDMSLENVGFMKERINGTNPVYISDVVDKINRMISADSQYVGLLIPIRNFDLIYNTQLPDYDTSVKEAIAQNYGAEAMRYIENLLADLQGNSKKKGIGSTFFSKVRGNYAKAVLTFNLSVSIKQAASYPAAASVLGYKALGKALLLPETDTGVKLIFAKAEKEFIEKYSPLLRYRLMDGAIAEIGEVNKNNGFVDKAMAKAPALFNWIQQIDGATVGRLWYASKYWVSDNMPNLQKNSDEYYKEVAKIFNKAVEQTQPNYTILQRSEFQRNSSEIIKGLCMFMTQRLQNLNIIYDSTANLQAKQEQYKNDKSEANKAELKLARSEFSHAISSQIVSAVVLSVMTFVASAIMGSMKRYRDDDDEVTLASVTEQIGKDSMSTLLGIVPFASDIEEYIESLITGDEYSLSNPTVDAIDDILGSIKKVVDLITKVQKGEADKDDIRYVIENLAGTISKPVGVPLSNIVKTYKAAVNAYKDIKNDEFGTWSSSRTLTENDYYQRYYDALISGDNKKLENAKRNLTEAGKTDKDIHDKMTTLLKTNQDIIDASQEYLLGNISEYSDKLDDIIAYGFDEQQVISAVNSAIGRIETLAKEKATGDETYEKDRADMISYGYDEKTLDTLVDKINSETEYEEKTTKVKSRYTVGDLYDAKGTGEYDTIYDDIKATQMANGKSEEEAEKYIESGIKREWKNNEPRYEEAKTAYENSDYNTYLRLVDELASDSDYSVDEVATMVTGYEHSNGLGYTASDVVKSLINNEGNEWVTMLRGIDGYYASQGKRRKNYTSYLTSSFAYQYKNAETNSEKVKIIKAMRRAGYSEKKIGELITGWSK